MRRRRIVSLWTPRLGAERLLRREGLPPDVALATLRADGQSLRVAALTRAAERRGVRAGQSAADARAVCPALRTRPADRPAEIAGLRRLQRWAGRFSPFVGLDPSPGPNGAPEAGEQDGLILDVAGAAHLFGGEAALLDDIAARLERLGLTARLGLADSRGAAWALARFAPAPLEDGRWPIAAPGRNFEALAPLPIAALRVSAEVADGLARLGLATVGDVARLPRAALARRFGRETVARLDQALGAAPEPITPSKPAPIFSARLSLPEPIGLESDLKAGLRRLLERVCARLAEAGQGARRLRLEIRRVDRETLRLEVGLARPRRDPDFIAPLFDKPIGEVDAGFGVDALRLEAVIAEPLAARQIHAGPEGSAAGAKATERDAFAALLSRLGGRVGFENLLRLRPGDSHAPDRAVIVETAAYAADVGAPLRRPDSADWRAAAAARPPRPLEQIAPEPLEILAPAEGRGPPARFRWRGSVHETAAAQGPERIAPEWWLDDPAWREGVRDYWRVATRAGDRLWLFHLPQLGAGASEASSAEASPAAAWRVAGRFV